MAKLGYGPHKRLPVKISTRNINVYRDPAVILIDQLKDIYIDGELEVVETSNWHSKVTRKDYAVGLNLTGSSVDDPDQNFYENYACGSERNYTDYCNKELPVPVKLAVMMSGSCGRAARDLGPRLVCEPPVTSETLDRPQHR